MAQDDLISKLTEEIIRITGSENVTSEGIEKLRAAIKEFSGPHDKEIDEMLNKFEKVSSKSSPIVGGMRILMLGLFHGFMDVKACQFLASRKAWAIFK